MQMEASLSGTHTAACSDGGCLPPVIDKDGYNLSPIRTKGNKYGVLWIKNIIKFFNIENSSQFQWPLLDVLDERRKSPDNVDKTGYNDR